MQHLLRHVRDRVGEKWYDLGIELLDSNDVDNLDIIQAEHPLDLKECCTKMFRLWLRKQPTASWNQLIEALRQHYIGLCSLAVETEQKLLQVNPQG